MNDPAEASPTRQTDQDLSDDAFLGGALQILQPRRGYRAGIDAVLLAAAVDEEGANGGNLLDVGAGVGTLGLCVARRIEGLRVTLLEREPQLCAIAAENIRRNGLVDRVRIVAGAVGESATELALKELAAESFTHVLANPPFMAPESGTRSNTRLKAASHAHEPGQSLDDWGRFMARMSLPGGTALMIHKAEHLGDVLACLNGRFGAVRILPLHARAGEPANRVIVKATKGSRAPLALLPGIILHDEGNAFLPHIDAVLRQGLALQEGL